MKSVIQQIVDEAVAELGGPIPQEEIDRLDRDLESRMWHTNPCAHWYWWMQEWARMTPGYGSQHSLWGIFGDVSGLYVQWARRNYERVFADPDDDGMVRFLYSTDDCKKYLNDPNRLVLTINLNTPISQVISNLEYVLPFMKKHNGLEVSPGRRALKQSENGERRQFCKRPHVPTLKKIAMAYLIRRDNPELSLYQIHLKMIECMKIGDPYLRIPSDTDADFAVKKEDASKAVSRYCRQAKQIIKGVGEGRFPVYS